jgi:hypothetical protein
LEVAKSVGRNAGKAWLSGFLRDIYGKGVRPTANEQAAAEAGKYKKDRAVLRQRVNAGLAALRKQPGVDSSPYRGHWVLFWRHNRP